MKKIISFSLWGNDPKYTIGAIKNLDIAKIIYPDWICRIYCGTSVPKEIIDQINLRDNKEIILMNEIGNWEAMFWRFYAAEDADIMLSRDTDSRLNLREKAAVDEWLGSNKKFHIMRDHPFHGTRILGGMWGVKAPLLRNIKTLIESYAKGNYYQVDQNFLRECVYPLIRKNCFVHDEFFENKNFPTKRNGLEFVGQSFDENDGVIFGQEESLNKNLHRSWFKRKLSLLYLK